MVMKQTVQVFTSTPTPPKQNRPVAFMVTVVPSKGATYRSTAGLYFDHSGGAS